MSAISKYYDIIYDANNKVKVGVYEFADELEIQRIYELLENCKHIRKIQREGYNLIITYKQRGNDTAE